MKEPKDNETSDGYRKTDCGDCWSVHKDGSVEILGENWATLLAEKDLREMLAQSMASSAVAQPPAVKKSEEDWKKEALRMLNEGYHLEALKMLRKHHGFVNRFVCGNCGHVKDTSLPCDDCGSWDNSVKAVHVAEASAEYKTERAKNDREISNMMGGK